MDCMNSFSMGDAADATVLSADGSYSVPGIQLDLSAMANHSAFTIGGGFHVECVDEFGSVVWATEAKNSITNAGILSILSDRYCAGTQYSQWYLMLVANSGFTAFALADTMTSHPGWSELSSSNYSDTTRVQWIPGTPSAGSVTNPTSSDYHMIPGSPVVVYGVALVTSNNPGGTSGLLEATAAFVSGPQSCKNGDVLRITYITGAATN